MTRYVTVSPHPPLDDLGQRYRQAHDPVARSHWHVLWLMAQGRHVPEVAMLVGDTANWVRAIVRRYDADGPAGIADRRQTNPAAAPLRSPALREELRDARCGLAPDGGLWTSPKVADRGRACRGDPGR